MLVEPLQRSSSHLPNRRYNKLKCKFNYKINGPVDRAKISGASPSINTSLKSSGTSLPSACGEKPLLKTVTSEVNSITPEKKDDVIMSESDAGGSSGGGEGSGGSSSPPKVDVEMEDVNSKSEENNKEATAEKAMDVDEADKSGGEKDKGDGAADDSKHKNGSDEGINDSKSSEKKSNNDDGGNNGSTNLEKSNDGTATEKSNGVLDKDEKSGGTDKEAELASYPLLVGTLSFSEQGGIRRHAIRGNWKYELSPNQPLRFELIRDIPPEENLKELPKDGEFRGSFSLQYEFKTSKGKLKTKSRVVAENGVKIAFVKQEGEPDTFSVKGQGLNEYGTFELFGTATKSSEEEYKVQLRKKYIASAPVPTPQPDGDSSGKKNKDKKRKFSGMESGASAPEEAEKELPPPSESFASGVVCLRGKLVRHTSENLGFSDVTHKITGVWSTGLDIILADPENEKGLCNKFSYEHKCTVESDKFPLSGRYTGWFYVNTDGLEKTQISERDISLKFKENNKGYHNVEGKGSNVYGKYTITGTFTNDGTITIFRHFQALKPKKTSHIKISTTPAPGPLNGKSEQKTTKPAEKPDPNLLSLDDVKVPDLSQPLEVVIPPEQYGAVSRGALKVNDDGFHSCSGNWAITNEHFSNNLTSKYHFGIEAHNAAEDAQLMLDRMKASGEDINDDRKISGKVGDGVSPVSVAHTTFPIDSARYKGSFKMRKGATKFQNVLEKQIVLRFVKNKGGSYNVYGKGRNEMGVFDIVGTLILQTKTNGIIQLYRMYEPVPVTATEPEPVSQISSGAKYSGKVFPGSLTEKVSGDSGPVPAMKPPEKFPPSLSTLQRRESSRQTKIPSRLEDDDPEAQADRLMEKCGQILKELKDKDMNQFFLAPVDPIAHGIPNYPQVIKNPMDLGTIQVKMDANEVDSPEEFARLVRLVFENAITFNTLPDHVVHQAARNLLIFFNQRFRSVERVLDATKKPKKISKAELKEMKRKEKEAAREAKKKAKEEEKERKRKPSEDGGKETKRRRLEDYIAENKSTLDAITEALPDDPEASVSRGEFNLLLEMVKQMQGHIVAVHKLLASSARAHAASGSKANSADKTLGNESSAPKSSPQKPKPKPTKKKAEKSEKSSESVKPDKVKKEAEPTAPPSPKSSPEQGEIEEEEKEEEKQDLRPLSFQEQENLSDAINRLPERLLPGAMQIIRESDLVNEDDEEIDLDIDQLDTKTQRKLQKFVMENVKPKRKKQTAKKQKQAAARASTPAPAPAPEPAPVPQPAPAPSPDQEESPKRKSQGDSLFSLGADDSDSDSDESKNASQPEKKLDSSKKDDPFADDDDDDDDDDDEDIKVDAFATNWVAPSKDNEKEEDDDQDSDKDDEDGLWDAARKEAEASKAREADRAKREEKMRAEAELAAQKRMAEAAALGEQVRAKREEEEAAEARLREEQEREAEEARKAAREKALQEVEEVKNTIDLEATRDIMRQYEQEFNDNYSAGGASPSSDFGF